MTDRCRKIVSAVSLCVTTSKFTVRGDLRVDFHAGTTVVDCPPPFGIGVVEGHIQLFGDIDRIASWMPERCEALILSDNSIESLSGLENHYCETLNVSNNSVSSLRGVSTVAPQLKSIAVMGNPVTSGTLELLMIEGLATIDGYHRDTFERVYKQIERYGEDRWRVTMMDGTVAICTSLEAATIVVGKQLQRGRAGIVRAHRELIELGLDDHAEMR